MLAESGVGDEARQEIREDLREIRSMFSILARPEDVAILEGSASWVMNVEEGVEGLNGDGAGGQEPSDDPGSEGGERAKRVERKGMGELYSVLDAFVRCQVWLHTMTAFLSLIMPQSRIQTIQAFSVVLCPSGSVIRLLCAALVRIVPLTSPPRPLRTGLPTLRGLKNRDGQACSGVFLLL